MNTETRIAPSFSGVRSLDEIRKICAEQNVPLDDTRYKRFADDHVLVGNKASGYALFNTFNGRFFGKTDTGVSYSSDSDAHENESWFQALLNFFYVR